MSPRALPIALLAVCVALAGCAYVDGPAEAGTPSPTQAPTATPTTAPSGTGSLPPGVTADGVEDPMALSNAHANALADAPFTVEVNTTERFKNGSLRTRETTSATVAEDERRYAIDYEVSGTAPSLMDASSGQLSAWADGEGVYQRLVVNGSTSYQRLHDANGDLLDPWKYHLADQVEEDFLYVLFSSFDVSVERVSEDGTTYYRLASEDLSNADAVASSLNADGIDRANLTALVDRQGIVVEYRLEYDARRDGESVSGVHEVAYDDVGSATVERPSWVDEAENATGE